MAGIDIYQPCPGGCGKKIKFCCSKDIAHEIERLAKLIQADQLQSAHDKVGQLLRQYPDRPCLLALQVEMALDSRNASDIVGAITEFVEKAPTNSLAISYSAMLAGPQPEAIMGILDRAFPPREADVPSSFIDNLVNLAGILERSRAHLPALAILRLSRFYRVDSTASAELLDSIERNPAVPFMERFDWQLDPLPSKASWRNEAEMVYEGIFRGAWTWASDYLQKMNMRVLDQPELLKAQALCEAWSAQSAASAATFRRYSQLRSIRPTARLWGEMMAQTLMLHVADKGLDFVEETFEIHDLDGLLENLRRNPFALSTDMGSALDDENGISPRQVYFAIDRPVDREATEIEAADIATVQATVAVFGRETDRPARLALRFVREPSCEAKLVPFLSSVASHIAENSNYIVTQQVSAAEFALNLLPMIPPRVSTIRRRRFLAELRELQLRNLWTSVPLAQLDGRTPLELAQQVRQGTQGQPGLTALTAAVRLLELDAVNSVGVDYGPLRDMLDVPRETPLEAADFLGNSEDFIDLHRVVVEDLSDEMLVDLFKAARYYRMIGPMRRLACELHARDARGAAAAGVEWDDFYAALVNSTQDLDESLLWVTKARQRALADGRSPAQWLVLELSLRFERREISEAERILDELSRRHLDEPGVEAMMRQVLSAVQANAASGARLPMGPLADGPEEPASQLWTPGAPEPVAPAAGGAAGSSKLWLPGSIE